MITRRGFVKLSGVAGLWVGVACKSRGKAPGPATPPGETPAADVASSASAPWQAEEMSQGLSAWIHIAEDDTVTYSIPECEMGQGVHTAVALILTAELGADWTRVVARHAPLNPGAFGRQSTGGSTSIRTNFTTIRTVAAAARELLVAAAAAEMGVEASKCRALESRIEGPGGGKSVRFGEVAKAAAELPAPQNPALRDTVEPGRETNRLDSPDKVTGHAWYGIDVRLDGMLTAKVAHSPSVGGTVKSVDDGAARQVNGVRDVVTIASGVAVIADNTWAADKGRRALSVTWKEPNAALSSVSIAQQLKTAAAGGKVVFDQGNVDRAFDHAPAMVLAEYSVPYLAHAPMEPLSCTARVSGDRCEIWTSTQSPSGAATEAARITGLSPEQIAVHSQYAGGGFGRRSQSDYVAEAVELAVKTGKIVKVVWDREDDIRGYHYRPCAYSWLRASVDPKRGTLIAWDQQIASPSILRQMGPLPDGIDRTAVDGVAKYAPVHFKVTYADVELPISTWFWRSVGHSQNAFICDGFMNEAAAKAGRDPLEFRLSTKLSTADGGKPVASKRLRAVLEMAADKAGWGKPAGEGIGRGVSVHESFGSFVAQVAEVSIDQGAPRVHRIVCVVDCGQTVNPRTIEAQMESGIAYGLSAALFGQITLDGGRVVQGNFDEYPVVRMKHMPAVETHIVSSTEAHGGVGEPGLPPVAGAVAGGLFALTGKPIRSLPIRL